MNHPHTTQHTQHQSATASSPEIQRWTHDMQRLRNDLHGQWHQHFSNSEAQHQKTGLPRWLFQFGGKLGEHASTAMGAGQKLSTQVGNFAQHHPWWWVGGAFLLGPVLKPALAWLVQGSRARWLGQGAVALGAVQMRKQFNRLLSSSVQGWLDRALAYGLDASRTSVQPRTGAR